MNENLKSINSMYNNLYRIKYNNPEVLIKFQVNYAFNGIS